MAGRFLFLTFFIEYEIGEYSGRLDEKLQASTVFLIINETSISFNLLKKAGNWNCQIRGVITNKNIPKSTSFQKLDAFH